jgi:tetraacyldisaccharide 4'-kinase
MPVDEPHWWYEAPNSLMPRLLAPVGWLVSHIAARRLSNAKSYRSSLRVVCIGNFTAGGTGKTPLAFEVASILGQMGEKPVFLSRGYGGTERGPHRVDVDRDHAVKVGDEPLLLARAAPVFIARDRAAGARAIEAEVAAGRLDASVIIMDDGLQNPSLAKDLTLAVVDAKRGVGNGRVMPAGPLRAPLALQLRLADAIIVNGPADATAPNAAIETLTQRFSGAILRASVTASGDTAWLLVRPLVAIAGIGNPRRFFDLVRTLGGQIEEEFIFADHQALAEPDAARILGAARQHGAGIVTTEKDLTRLAGATGARAQLAIEAKPLPIALTLPSLDRMRLEQLLLTALDRRP